MEINIYIDTGNAAFEDYPDELDHILRTAGAKVKAQIARDLSDIRADPKVRDELLDINGNTVGGVSCVWRELVRVKCDTCGWEGRHGELECYRYDDGEPAEMEYVRCPQCFDEDQVGTVGAL